MDSFEGLWFECDDNETESSDDQCDCERGCASFLKGFKFLPPKLRQERQIMYTENGDMKLLRDQHIRYLKMGLGDLPAGFVSLDCSRAWICYWVLHALYLLGDEDIALNRSVIKQLQHIQNPSGGFGVR